MLKGVGTGISSAIGFAIFFNGNYVFIKAVEEIFSYQVTSASYYFVFGVIGGISELLTYLNHWVYLTYKGICKKNKIRKLPRSNRQV